MNASELRIGNFVLYNTYHDYIGAKNIKDKVINIESISNNGVNLEISNYSHCPENYWIPLENITPIPLTEEWLLKLGFKTSKIKDKSFTKDYSFAISTADDKFSFIQGNFVCQLVLRELKYVHELQNLIFALCGKELEIKL